MPLQTMYAGMVNSPETTLTNSISPADTTIYVLDPSRVPEPLPNLMVLGTGTNAETVLVTALTDSAMTVTRGYQGIPKDWPAGTIIARNFTAYDYDALRQNIDALAGDVGGNADAIATKATKVVPAAPGNLASLAADGDLQDTGIANTAIVGQNLLINANFRNPVNQRGNSSYSVTGQYTIDRFKLISGTVSVVAGGITLNGTIVQVLEQAAGTNVVASVSAGTASYNNATKTFTLTATGQTIEWAKLELGSIATPFVPQDYGTELVKCQRYYLPKAPVLANSGFSMVAITANKLLGSILFPCQMRIPPTIDLTKVQLRSNVDGSTLDVTGGLVQIDAMGISALYTLTFADGALVAGHWYCVAFEADSEMY